MSYIGVDLKYKDMYAIKHALKEKYNRENGELEKLCTESNLGWDYEEQAKFNRLEKDIAHEKRLIEKFETEIANFKAKNKIK